MTVSVGVALYRGDRINFFNDADRALYEAKDGGRDHWGKAYCVLLAGGPIRSGQIYGATSLVPVASAQVSGVSYKNLGDAGLQFLEV